jgi:hypothetical protein
MLRRAAKFVSVTFVGLIAGMLFTTLCRSAEPAAAECLSDPNGEAPHGSHWYYRIDHATKRHCWYVREEREKLSQNARPKSSAPATPTVDAPQAALQPLVADAHAEWSRRMRIDQPTPGDTPAAAPVTQAQPSTIASRWPDPSATASAAPSNAMPSEPDVDTEIKPAVPRQPPAPAVSQLAAEGQSQMPAYPMPVQLAGLMGALLLAGVMGSIIFRFVGMRRPANTKIGGRRVVNWDNANIDRTAPSPHPAADARARAIESLPDLYLEGGANARIAEIFAQLRIPAELG